MNPRAFDACLRSIARRQPGVLPRPTKTVQTGRRVVIASLFCRHAGHCLLRRRQQLDVLSLALVGSAAGAARKRFELCADEQCRAANRTPRTRRLKSTAKKT